MGGDSSAVGGKVDVAITIFACEGDGYCGAMANGRVVHEGAAACGYSFELGQRFHVLGDPTGREYICSDRGLGPYHWVDIWFQTAEEGYAWLSQTGDYGTVILR